MSFKSPQNKPFWRRLRPKLMHHPPQVAAAPQAPLAVIILE